MKHSRMFLAVLIVLLATNRLAAQTKEVAITIDDLPLNGPQFDAGRLRTMTDKILAAINKHKIPVVGFVNESLLLAGGETDARIAILKAWSDGGVELGNHTYSHLGFKDATLADYEDDFIRGESVIRSLLKQKGQRARYFRHPFLQMGATREIEQSFEKFIGERGYKIAPVTIDVMDWMILSAYSGARARGDAEAMKRVSDGYLKFAEGKFDFCEQVAGDLFGRPIKHILLLHANELTADNLDGLATMLENKGYRFISLEEALKDPVYQAPDKYSPTSDWLSHWAFSKGKQFTSPAPPEFLRTPYLDNQQRNSPQPQRQLTPEQQALQEATRQDHQRMLEALKITSLRPGANPNNPQAPNAVNYDESKANPYPKLPDPLVLKNGKKVTSAKMWFRLRRPEIVEDFDREVYGRVPKNTPKVTWEVTTIKETKFDIPVITKQLIGHVDNSAYPQITVNIQVTLVTPADAKAGVPVMMEFGFAPRPLGSSVAASPAAATGGRAPNWQQQLLMKGWGYAIIVPTSIQADNGAGLTKGIIGLCNKGQPRKPDDWGALRAWAWGASRALDYFETDKAVDARQVGIEGLSRYGKAALVTMAYDQRFAIGFIGSSGEGGAKLHRRNFGELVENLAGAGEYHWMAGNFIKYGGPLTWDDLPVDAHELIALCAPRPVFISYGAAEGPGAEGKWVDQRGSFMAAVAAGPVFKLLGKKDLGTTEFPPVETALIDGDLAWRQHSGGHTTGPNWPTFLTFASRYIKGPAM